MRAGRVTCVVLVALLAVALAAPAAAGARGQGPAPEARARLDAFAAALTNLTADGFEAMAQQHFTPALLARRSAADRRAMVGQLKDDFGTITVRGIQARPDGAVTIIVRGSTGTEGRFDLTLEPAPSYRIAGIGIDIGGADDGADAPPPPISGSMAPDALAGALDGYLREQAATGAFSGSVLVARDGRVVFDQAYGLADRPRAIANTPTTRFNIGSINKIFTKTAIARLMVQGKLSLTDTVGSLLPGYPNPDARGATVDQLLTHQAGIADFFGPAFNASPKSQFRSNADYYRFVAPQPLLFPPGTRRQYCNGCYIVLGQIVEKLAGVPYERYVAEHVFGPAGMTGAGFFHADRLPAGVAVGYSRRGAGGGPDTPLRSNETMHGAAGSGAGGAYASTADLLAFDNALREGRLLDPKTTAWVLGTEQAVAGTRAGGLGIAGGAPGLNAALESDGPWTVVVLANLDPPAAERLGLAIHRQLSK